MPGSAGNNAPQNLLMQSISGKYHLLLLAGLLISFRLSGQNAEPGPVMVPPAISTHDYPPSNHDLPSYEYLSLRKDTNFRAGFRMLAPRIAFKLTGGWKRYRHTNQLTDDCLLPLLISPEILYPMSADKYPGAELYLKNTLSDSITDTRHCLLQARSIRHIQRIWVNYLLGNFISGTGPENTLFPPDTPASNALKESQLLKKAVRAYVKDRKDTLFDPFHYRAHFGPLETIRITAHPTGIEHFTGSFDCSIVRTSDTTWYMVITNITSVTSADLYSAFAKPSSWLKSFPRTYNPTPYGNIFQVFQLHLTRKEMDLLAPMWK